MGLSRDPLCPEQAMGANPSHRPLTTLPKECQISPALPLCMEKLENFGATNDSGTHHLQDTRETVNGSEIPGLVGVLSQDP